MDMVTILDEMRKNGTSPEPSISDECPLCGGVGYTVRRSADGNAEYRECECSIRKRNLQRIEKSGLKELLQRCTMENYRATEPWQKQAKEAAERYLADWRGRWFYAGGSPGSGKTHLCTAMCGKLMDAGLPVRYALRLEAVKDISTDRLRELAEADKEGRLVVLPCQVGTATYYIRYPIAVYPDESEPEIKRGIFTLCDLDRVGHSVFLTLEEAEKALEAMKK